LLSVVRVSDMSKLALSTHGLFCIESISLAPKLLRMHILENN
jgi:hypothetical protein